MEKAFVMLTIDVGSEREVLDSLKEIPGIKEIHQVYGVYDLIAYIEAETLQELKDLIDTRIRNIDKIRLTLPVICVKENDLKRLRLLNAKARGFDCRTSILDLI